MYCPYCKSEYRDDILECPHCNTTLAQSPPDFDHNTKSPFHPSQYLNDLEEWNRNQYNPGYWTGGNIPPHVKVLSKAGSKTIGIVALICGILMFGFIVNSLLNKDFVNPEEILLAISGNLVGVFFAALFVWAGIQRIKESKTKYK